MVLPGCAVVACVVGLAGCGRTEADDSVSQIAARVNREEISVHQVNFLMQRQGEVSPEQADTASRQTLETLLDQEVAVQAAVEQRLDRDPQVVQALEAVRRELLARAYAERLTQGVQPPSATEVKQYYDSRPALFSRRRLYTLVDTAVEANPQEQQTLKAQLPTTRNAKEVAALLRQAGLRFGSRRVTLGAEALPLASVDALAALNEGQSLIVTGARDAHVFTVVEVSNAPLGLEAARPHIENFLMVEQRRKMLDQQIKSLRSAARIEYRGRFAETSALPTAAPALRAIALHEDAASSPTSQTTTTTR